MLTLFAVPKAFHGHVEVIQRNAIQSWLRLRPVCEIILLGEEAGTAAVAAEFNICHVPRVARNEYGTPVLNSVFEEAEPAGTHETMCYVNADILLFSDFSEIVQKARAAMPRSLMVGCRWDVEIHEPIDFDLDWQAWLMTRLRDEGKRHAHTGIDYFVFPRGLWRELPAFAIGRSMWDSWLVYRACSRNIPVVDLTKMAKVVHQDHDYSHHARDRASVWEGPEAKRNLELAGGRTHAYTLLDARYELTPTGIRRRISPYLLYRAVVNASERHGAARLLLKLIRFGRERLFPAA